MMMIMMVMITLLLTMYTQTHKQTRPNTLSAAVFRLATDKNLHSNKSHSQPMDANANQVGSMRLRHRRGGCKVPPRQTPNSPGADAVGTGRDGPSVVVTRSVGKGKKKGDVKRNGLSSAPTVATDSGSVAAGPSRIKGSTSDGLSSHGHLVIALLLLDVHGQVPRPLLQSSMTHWTVVMRPSQNVRATMLIT